MTIQDLKDKKLILFECYSGSHLFGTEREDSDIDFRGIFILPKEYLYTNDYIEQISDEKNDTTYYEIRRFLKLLIENKPNVIEMLFAPDDKIIYRHPMLDELFNNRDLYINKSEFAKATVGFAESQIKKAKGTNKKLNWEKEDKTRKTVLDFCFVPHRKGSSNVVNWLERKGLKQEYCGLSALNNMRYAYNVYYDYWQHIEFENLNFINSLLFVKNFNKNFPNSNISYFEIFKNYKKYFPLFRNFKFKGIVQDKETSNNVSTYEVPLNLVPINVMQFNLDGYKTHCKRYKEYVEYLKNRNVSRYTDVKNHNQQIDGKNLLHMIRSLKMCDEYLKTSIMNINRKNIDRDYLLSIRKGEYNLNEIITDGQSMINDIKNIHFEGFDKEGLKEKMNSFVIKLCNELYI